jgi:hypothetical protein
MAKFIINLFLDGYESEEEMKEACEEFIYEQLNFAGSSIKIQPVGIVKKIMQLNPLRNDTDAYQHALCEYILNEEDSTPEPDPKDYGFTEEEIKNFKLGD